jgi:hypothetical protein
MSSAPPGGASTTMCTGREGQACALAMLDTAEARQMPAAKCTKHVLVGIATSRMNSSTSLSGRPFDRGLTFGWHRVRRAFQHFSGVALGSKVVFL